MARDVHSSFGTHQRTSTHQVTRKTVRVVLGTPTNTHVPVMHTARYVSKISCGSSTTEMSTPPPTRMMIVGHTRTHPCNRPISGRHPQQQLCEGQRARAADNTCTGSAHVQRRQSDSGACAAWQHEQATTFAAMPPPARAHSRRNPRRHTRSKGCCPRGHDRHPCPWWQRVAGTARGASCGRGDRRRKRRRLCTVMRSRNTQVESTSSRLKFQRVTRVC